MKTIFQYSSFRAYIRDLFDMEKASANNVTMAQYAKKFGLSGSALNLILFGKRNLTISNLNQVARALRLSKSEREYFEALVLSEQADHSETKSYYSDKLKAQKKDSKHSLMRVTDRQLLSSWYIPALLIYLIDFEKIQNFDDINYEKIAKKFSISKEEIKRLLLLFQKIGLLAVDPKAGVHIVFDRVSSQVHQKEFVRVAQLEASNRLNKEFENPEAFFRATVFSISKTEILRFRKDILELIDKYVSDDNSNNDERVLIQGVLSFFPL